MSILDPLFRRIELRDHLSAAEKQALLEAASGIEEYETGEDLSEEGSWPTNSRLLISGFTTRYNILPDGTRQITAIQVAGDFVDLHAFPLKKMDHAVGALTPCRVVSFPHQRLLRVTEQHPHLTRVLWLLTLLDGAIHRQWLLVMGQMAAVGHLAHLICEMYIRLSSVGLARDYVFRFPITQVQLADTTGMSAVHINRVLQELRARELIEWQSQVVKILDWDRLVQVAQFHTDFLRLQNLPR